MFSLFTQPSPRVPIRGLHLDLKGLPPLMDRLLELLKVIAAGRYNMLLVEWEDMFPWTVDERFRSPTAYTPDEIHRFVDAAARLNLEIVPLVQCLGHMEMVLNVSDYAHMRELPDNHCDVINPLAAGTSELICQMIDDVTALLPNLRYFHLGGDEAWALGSHPQSKAYVEAHGKAALYLHHLQPLIDHLEKKSLRPILWHDMMVKWDTDALRKLAEKADLMVWGYSSSPDVTPHHYITKHIQRFHDAGISLWGAAAYKGADGVTADLPNLTTRQDNAVGWMQVNERIPFKGIVATAWSRHSTQRPQNEPIDGALDALLLVGAILHDGNAAPENRQACLELLEQLGEAERFNAVHGALKRLAEHRRWAWSEAQWLREQMAMGQYDPARQSKGLQRKSLGHVRLFIDRCTEPAEHFRTAMQGALAPRWIDEYVAVRLNALNTLHADLSEMINVRD